MLRIPKKKTMVDKAVVKKTLTIPMPFRESSTGVDIEELVLNDSFSIISRPLFIIATLMSL